LVRLPEQLESLAVVRIIRRVLFALFVLGATGTGLELLLLGHTEDLGQLSPLLLIAASIPLAIWSGADSRPRGVRAFQVTMGLFIANGFLGLGLHYWGNAEFELEMYPSLGGLTLWWEAMRGATPTLAPGTMIELGLIGLAYTYRHPGLSSRNDGTPNSQTGA
jgi:hypothetical protein